MNYLFAVLCILFVTVFVNVLGKNTQTYTQWKQGKFRGDIFLPETYLGLQQQDNPCQKIKSRAQYLKKLQSYGITCTGSWCDSEGGFGCKVEPCYNMEHIIDIKNSLPELGPEYDRNILGNLVMAYSTWNKQVGNLPSWDEIKSEKGEIYGEIFETAMEHVRRCHQDSSFGEDIHISKIINKGFIILSIIVASLYISMYLISLRENLTTINNEDIEFADFNIGTEEGEEP